MVERGRVSKKRKSRREGKSRRGLFLFLRFSLLEVPLGLNEGRKWYKRGERARTTDANEEVSRGGRKEAEEGYTIDRSDCSLGFAEFVQNGIDLCECLIDLFSELCTS